MYKASQPFPKQSPPDPWGSGNEEDSATSMNHCLSAAPHGKVEIMSNLSR